MINPFITTILIYVGVYFAGFLTVAIFLKSFFFKYLRVRGSFGDLVLVKVREVNRDTYVVAKVEEKRLKFKYLKILYSIDILSEQVFYRCMGVPMADFDSSSNGLSKTDFKAIPGFDMGKQNNLLVRALTRPVIASAFSKENLILLLAFIILLVCGYIAYTLTKDTEIIKNIAGTVSRLTIIDKGSVVGSSMI